MKRHQLALSFVSLANEALQVKRAMCWPEPFFFFGFFCRYSFGCDVGQCAAKWLAFLAMRNQPKLTQPILRFFFFFRWVQADPGAEVREEDASAYLSERMLQNRPEFDRNEQQWRWFVGSQRASWMEPHILVDHRWHGKVLQRQFDIPLYSKWWRGYYSARKTAHTRSSLQKYPRCLLHKMVLVVRVVCVKWLYNQSKEFRQRVVCVQER